MKLVSATPAGIPVNSFAEDVAISSDGRFVGFSSAASNLVEDDLNGRTDVFVLDRLTSEVERVSLSSSEVEPSGDSDSASLSSDGRYVAFASFASDLVVGDTNGSTDVFRRDRATGETVRVSVTDEGAQVFGADSYAAFPSISNDGAKVAFVSFSPELVPGDTNGALDVFVRDFSSGATRRASLVPGGGQVTDVLGPTNLSPYLSGNGRYVAFASPSLQLGGFADTYEDIFRHDTTNTDTVHVSFRTLMEPSNGSAYNPCVSADGRFVVFESNSAELVSGDTNEVKDIFLRDMSNGNTDRISVATDGSESNGSSSLGRDRAVSNDGRYVVFSSLGDNLVSGDQNGFADVFIRDRVAKTTTRVSVGPNNEESDGPSYDGTISSSGAVVAFASDSTTFGVETQGEIQVWVRVLE
jgi:TolB protein